MVNSLRKIGIIALMVLIGLFGVTSCDVDPDYNREIHIDTELNMTLASISVTGMPDKTAYITGETLDLDGLAITAVYSNGSLGIVTNYTTDPENAAVLNNSGAAAIQVSYTENDITRTVNFNVNVIENTGTTGISFSIEQIIDYAPVFYNITLSRTNTGYPASYRVNLDDAVFYDSILWEIAGIGFYSGQTITGGESFFILDTSNIRYNSLGGHLLRLTVMKNGFRYLREIPFTIVQ